MIINKTIGHISDKAYQDKQIQRVNMPFDHAHKRIQRLKAEDGTEFGIRLSESDRKIGLKEGDIIYSNPENNSVYVIHIEEEPVLIIEIKDPQDQCAVGYVIGNRHAKLYQGEKALELVTPYEKTLEEMLLAIDKITVTTGHRKLLAEDDLMRILPQGSEDHEHHHDHDHD